ncbi:hypothetical protein [Enterocloster bolteae]|uniref:hypothetical protein n=1 Tax=Enterocloster bolteae TaxID=208479 RepID=UPI00206C882C|nr:MAG TPA: hypothetical protein [Caudoviricetes sp.]
MAKPQVTPQKFVFAEEGTIIQSNKPEIDIEFPGLKVTIEIDAYRTNKIDLKNKLQSIFEEVLEYFD